MGGKRLLFFILLLIALIFIFWAAHWWSCHYLPGCDNGQSGIENATVTPIDSGVNANRFPLAFNWSDATPVTDDELFPAYRDSILGMVKEGELLRIMGPYYEGEIIPGGFENMGFARAAKIKELLTIYFDTSKIKLRAVKLGGVMDADTTSLFDGQQFESIVDGEQKKITITQDRVTIYFPDGKDDRRLDQSDVEDAIKRFVESQKASGRKVHIEGHTDSRSSSAYNLRLGQNRANKVKELLMEKGVPAEAITTVSKGESEPVASNATEEGKAENRRAVVTLLPN